MKRPILTMVSAVLLCLLAASGCAYTIRYSVKTNNDREETAGRPSVEAPKPGAPSGEIPSAEEISRTFAAEHMIRKGRYGYSMERKLLAILSQSLENLGWSPLSGEEGAEYPAYTFTVDFERPETDVNHGFEFSVSTGSGSGFFMSTIVDTYGNGNLRILRITATMPKISQPGESPTGERQERTWSAEIRTESPAAKMVDLARYAMPKALERFPEPGYWELKEKVVTRRESSPRRR